MALVHTQAKRYVPDLMSLQRTCEVTYPCARIDGAEKCR
ncbi:dehydrogenase phosphohydrolase [Aeromonas hydrophila]|nr:dehydrogenase phosphohydrolase [Aeromonas hydrophila]